MNALPFPPAALPGLGLDAGGTQTRWALGAADGSLQAEGSVAPLSGLQLGSADGQAALAQTLADLAAALREPGLAPDGLQGVVAGITGFDDAQQATLRSLLSTAFAVAPAQVRAMSDIELACRAAFAPGAGMVVYAGTGSVAAFIDRAGQMHRAGGRGVVIDDAGGGHWVAQQALRVVWRAEDAAPGAWQQSLLARNLFEHIGGHDWAHTRQWVYGASRGQLGLLALAVAAAAPHDAQALQILQHAGQELARLALTLHRRLLPQFGSVPISLAGRVFDLHPAVTTAFGQALAVALPQAPAVQRLTRPAHHCAARLAAAEGSA